ncbi:hypothetical protein OF385_11000 [Glutamicibacter sp. JL.03c]|uniref:hypothetical protein n=1 Tax=Glutamicibacter sp. JL.03c TaxID=2984842 RepID=UPI0021F72E3F|nr:hypothetical protein [Glutamicibacter sp. JL.03c]UYQ76561.1 hypothetical protein OF385_11000 [Glutamicibacter sp. JL.03c]
MEEVSAYLQEATDRTEDEKLVEALQSSIDQNSQMIQIMSDEDLTLTEKTSKVQNAGSAAECEKNGLRE